MSRLIEIDDTAALPARITLGRADVLLIRASGGQVVDGPDLLEVSGHLYPPSSRMQEGLFPLKGLQIPYFLSHEKRAKRWLSYQQATRTVQQFSKP